MMEVQDEAREAFDNDTGLEAGVQYKGTMFEEVFIDAFIERQNEYIAYLEQTATMNAANAGYENGGW